MLPSRRSNLKEGDEAERGERGEGLDSDARRCGGGETFLGWSLLCVLGRQGVEVVGNVGVVGSGTWMLVLVWVVSGVV